MITVFINRAQEVTGLLRDTGNLAAPRRAGAPTLVPMANATSVDLNADLGEGFGVWRLGDDEAMLGIVTSANLACGFHAGDPAGLRTVCRQAAAAGRAHRRAGRLPRPRGLRTSLHRRVARGSGGRRHLPDRRAAGAGAFRGHRGQLRQTPWRPVQHDRHRREPGSRGRRGGTRRGHRPARARPRRFGVLRRGRPAGPAHRRRGLRRPRLPARRDAGAPHATGCGAARRRRDRRAGAAHGHHRARHRRRRHRSGGCAWNRFACTAIHPERYRSPPRCASAWRPAVSVWRRSADAAQTRPTRHLALCGPFRGPRRGTGGAR